MKNHQITSPLQPEPKVYPGWGSSAELGYQPFQVLVDVNPEKRPYYIVSGASHDDLVKRSEKAKVMGYPGSLYFYPNHVATHINKKRRRPAKFYSSPIGEGEPKGRFKVSRLNFVFADIDCYRESETEFIARRYEALDAIYDLPVRPDVIVDSGWGYHIYYAIKPIDVVDTVVETYNEELEHLKLRYLRLLRILVKSVGGDPQAVGWIRMMRVPDTWNLKPNRSPVRSRYLEGDLAQARENPRHTLESLEEWFELEPIPIEPYEAVRWAKGKPKGPLPDLDVKGLDEALATFEGVVWEKLRRKPPVVWKRYFAFLWGLRAHKVIIHSSFRRYYRDGAFTEGLVQSEPNRQRVSEVLEVLEKHLGWITVERFPKASRRGSEVRLTRVYLELFRVPEPWIELSSRGSLDKLIERIKSEPYLKGKRREQAFEDMGTLYKAGLPVEQIREVIRWKVLNRPEGLARDEEALRIADWDIEGAWGPRPGKRAS